MSFNYSKYQCANCRGLFKEPRYHICNKVILGGTVLRWYFLKIFPEVIRQRISMLPPSEGRKVSCVFLLTKGGIK